MAEREKKPLNENSAIKDLELQAANTRQLVDRINRAMYGMTWAEHEWLHGRCPEEGDKQ